MVQKGIEISVMYLKTGLQLVYKFTTFDGYRTNLKLPILWSSNG